MLIVIIVSSDAEWELCMVNVTDTSPIPGATRV